VQRHDSRLVDSLLREGARPDLKDRQGVPVLQLAVAAGDLATVRVLLRRGAKVDARDRKGATALMRAAETAGQEPALVNLLLAVGANPGVKDQGSDTALAYAQRANRPAALEALGAAARALRAEKGR
jgi:ankyrin repeat protein